MGKRHLVAWGGLLGLLAGLAGPATAFTILQPHYYVLQGGGVDVQATLEQAPRWDAAPNSQLSFGLSVAVLPGFAATMVAGYQFPESDYEDAVRRAFAAWETPEIRFHVDFAASFGDITLAAIHSSSDPNFAGNGFGGLTYVDAALSLDRVLTNGEVLPGWYIRHADVEIAFDNFHNLFDLLSNAGLFGAERRIDRFQNLLMHEIGHALGLGHPGDAFAANFDTDLDPLNAAIVDPLDPFAGIVRSPNVDRDAMMAPLKATGPGLLGTQLRNDDRLGRDVLYPSLPEPALALPAAAAAAAALRRRRLRRP